MVPADGPESAEVYGHSEGASIRLREGNAAGSHRGSGRLQDPAPSGGVDKPKHQQTARAATLWKN